jgi:hypothetical protein
LGEKSELVDELKSDIDDIKAMYRELVERTVKWGWQPSGLNEPLQSSDIGKAFFSFRGRDMGLGIFTISIHDHIWRLSRAFSKRAGILGASLPKRGL